MKPTPYRGKFEKPDQTSVQRIAGHFIVSARTLSNEPLGLPYVCLVHFAGHCFEIEHILVVVTELI